MCTSTVFVTYPKRASGAPGQGSPTVNDAVCAVYWAWDYVPRPRTQWNGCCFDPKTDCARAAMRWMPTRSPRSSSERRAEIRRDEDAARRGDDTRFVEIRILPTEENLEAVCDYDGPEESLSQAEKFMRAVGKEPRCQLPAECRGQRLLTPLRV